ETMAVWSLTTFLQARQSLLFSLRIAAKPPQVRPGMRTYGLRFGSYVSSRRESEFLVVADVRGAQVTLVGSGLGRVLPLRPDDQVARAELQFAVPGHPPGKSQVETVLALRGKAGERVGTPLAAGQGALEAAVTDAEAQAVLAAGQPGQGGGITARAQPVTRPCAVAVGQVQAQLRAEPEIGGNAQRLAAAVDLAEGRADPARQQQGRRGRGNLPQSQPVAEVGQVVATFEPAQAITEI